MTSEDNHPKKEDLPPLPEDETIQKRQLQVKILLSLVLIFIILAMLAVVVTLLLSGGVQEMSVIQRVIDITNQI